MISIFNNRPSGPPKNAFDTSLTIAYGLWKLIELFSSRHRFSWNCLVGAILRYFTTIYELRFPITETRQRKTTFPHFSFRGTTAIEHASRSRICIFATRNRVAIKLDCGRFNNWDISGQSSFSASESWTGTKMCWYITDTIYQQLR